MNQEIQLDTRAVSIRPNKLSLALETCLLDEEGNTVQIIPFAVEQVLYPFGGNIDALIRSIIEQIGAKLEENRKDLPTSSTTH